MSVVSIHPEDLLDKLVRGEISPAERELLEAHLSSCDVCRFELTVSVDFQNESRALSAAKPAGLPLPQSEPRRSRRVIWAIAAAMLIASTGAVASVTRVGQTVIGLVRFGGDQLPVASRASARPVAARATANEPPTPAAVSAPATLEAPAPRATPALRRVAARAQASAESELDEDDESGAQSAPTLFAEANKARRRGDLTKAGVLYRDLQKKFPRSQEAGLSQVTLSMLLLDRGEAAAALAGFDTYLTRSRRPLEAEALVGRARALGALGSPSAEANAWRDVQRKYPSSVYARQATDRLAALGQP